MSLGQQAAVDRFAPTREVLPSGLTVIHQRNVGSPAISISLGVAAGSVFESADQAGLASLVAKLLDRGTKHRSKQEIGEALDFSGAELGASAGRHTAVIGGKVRVDDLQLIMDLVAESASAADFPETEVEKARGERLTSIREDRDSPRQRAVDSLRALVYPPDHPYAWRLLGTEETVAALSRDNLASFYGRHYRPEASVLVVVGNVEQDIAMSAAAAAFDVWPQQQPLEGGIAAALPAIADAPGPQAVEREIVTMHNKMQVDIALGHPGLRRSDPDYYAASLMNMILGRFAMGGRLGRSVREEKGMAYYAFSTLQAGVGPGPFMVSAGVHPDNVGRALDAIVSEMEQIGSETVGDEELADAKSAIIRSLPRTLETNEGMAALLHSLELHRLGLDYLQRFPELVTAVDADAIQRSAAKYLRPERYGVAIAGPYPPQD